MKYRLLVQYTREGSITPRYESYYRECTKLTQKEIEKWELEISNTLASYRAAAGYVFQAIIDITKLD
jgi:hypothetical protein